jgi:copper transport protein
MRGRLAMLPRKYPLLFSAVIGSILVLALAQLAVPAYGHALPTVYSIEPNSIVAKDSPPSAVTISFSERPDPKTSYIRVINSQNERIDNDDFAVLPGNGRQAAVTLDASKMTQDGVYTISWRTMSLDDGHIAQGSYVFGFGNVTPDTIGDGGSQPETTFITSTTDALLRWPLIVSQSAIVGGVIAHFVLQKGFRTASIAIRRFALILAGSAVAVAICGTSLIVLQTLNLAEDSSQSTFFSTMQALIIDSPAGTVWMIRIATSVIIGGLAIAYLRSGGVRSNVILVPILVAGALSIFSNSMLSHNSAVTFVPTLAVLSDWVHFMAVSAWVGGLFYFSAVLVPRLKGASGAYELALILPRFSLIATASLGIIGVSGLYMAWIHLQSFDSLVSTQYGNNLIIKLATALPMVLLGGYHQVKLHRGIVALATIGKKSSSSETVARNGGDAVSRFSKTIKIESMLGIAVLLAASFLTITSPPSHSHDNQPGTPGGTSGYSQSATVDGVDLSLSISPFHAGFNTFSVTIREAGQIPENINAVFLRLRNNDAGIGPIIATLNQTSAGVFSSTGGYLSQQGNWDIDLIVQRIGAYDLNHRFEAQLAASHEMDMGEMGHTTDHEAESETISEPEPAPPQFDSFAILATGLAGAVIAGSILFYRKSKRQLKETLRTLDGKTGH